MCVRQTQQTQQTMMDADNDNADADADVDGMDMFDVFSYYISFGTG